MSDATVTCPQCHGVGRWPNGDDMEPCMMCRENGFIDPDAWQESPMAAPRPEPAEDWRTDDRAW